MENLLYWARQVTQYLEIVRIVLGLTEEEQRLLDGLREAIDQTTEQQASASTRKT